MALLSATRLWSFREQTKVKAPEFPTYGPEIRTKAAMAEVATSSVRTWARERVTRRRAVHHDTVSFAELILAHYLRQVEVFKNRRLDGDWEEPYRKKLRSFVHAHGRVVAAYWCTREPSAVALTQKVIRPRHMLGRKDSIIRLHAETDWITRDAPDVAHEIHQCEALAIKVSEILRGTSELIAMQWLLASIARLLGSVDHPEGKVDAAAMKRVAAQNREELVAIREYYARAGGNQARLVYFQGMMYGAMALALLVGIVAGVLYLADFSHWHAPATQNILVVIGMGAVGAIVSVMSRMAGRGAFAVDFEVGRPTVRRLGSFRPFIGATFALALYFGLKSDLFQVGMTEETIYYFAIVAFLAGFSERWAKVLLDGAGSPSGTGSGPNADSTARAARNDINGQSGT